MISSCTGRKVVMSVIIAVLLLSVLVIAGTAAAEANAGAGGAASSKRIVALGDIHGDVEQLYAALTMAELIDNRTHAWIGGPQDKLVQVGDLVDRGAQDKAVLEAMQRLQREAHAAGSEFIILLGNHEVMNIRRQTHYVHPDVFAAFGGREGHAAAWARDGDFGAWVRTFPVAHVDMDTLFVHAGLLPEFAALGVDKVNALARDEISAADDNSRLRGGSADWVLGVDGPVWTRKLVHRAEHGDCRLLRQSLDALGVSRMVVGHTPQQEGTLGVFCDDRLIVVDIGLSKWMYGNLAMLELSTNPSSGELEMREIIPHTVVAAEQQGTVPGGDAPAATLAEELQRDPVKLQEIFDTMRQAQTWTDGADDAGRDHDATQSQPVQEGGDL